MDLSLPDPDVIRQRIDACECELRSLRRLLRAAQDARDADSARQSRERLLIPEDSHAE